MCARRAHADHHTDVCHGDGNNHAHADRDSNRVADRQRVRVSDALGDTDTDIVAIAHANVDGNSHTDQVRNDNAHHDTNAVVDDDHAHEDADGYPDCLAVSDAIDHGDANGDEDSGGVVHPDGDADHDALFQHGNVDADLDSNGHCHSDGTHRHSDADSDAVLLL